MKINSPEHQHQEQTPVQREYQEPEFLEQRRYTWSVAMWVAGSYAVCPLQQ